MIVMVFLLLYMVFMIYEIFYKVFEKVEGLVGMSYVFVGFIGFVIGGYFFFDWIWQIWYWGIDNIGRFFSGGFILIIYMIIGIKVGMEFSGIVDNMFKEEVRE